MAERNQIKQRKCAMCGWSSLGKASTIKEHGRECKQRHELAAATALMQKMQEEALKPAITERKADERVMLAEGD